MLGTSEAAMSDRGGEHSEGDSSAPARRSARTAKAAAAAGTAGKSLESRMRDQDEAGDDLRKESDSEGGHSADDSGDEEVVPQKRKARAQKKDPAAAKKAKTQIEEGGGRQNAGRPGNSRSARAKPTAKLDGDSIFQVVASSESSLEAAVADWLAAYSEDKVAATCELLNFLLQAAGYPGNSLDVSVLEDPDGNDISEILEALNLRIEKGEIKNEEVSLQEYPLISRKYAAKKSQPGEQNKFAKGLRQWWIRWIERMRHNILHAREEDDQENDAATQSYAWDVLKVYTLTLSSSPMRHLRHTATFAALAMCSGLCQAGRKAADEEASLQRQLQAEKSKTGKRHETLQSRQKELESMRKAIDVECAEIFNGVFVHRYRDVDALIRSDCIRELGAWIKTYPETFLDAQYLRYAGWMMSDRTPKTRLPSVVFLKDLLRDPQAATVFVPGLRQFLERFRPRLLDIAQRDTDRRCREEAAQVVVDAALLGALGEEDEIDDAILPMLFDENGIVRQAAAKHFVNLWKTSSEDLVAGAQDNLTASHGQLKALVQLVCKALLTIDGKTGGEVPFTEEHALQIPELGFWYMHEAASLAGDELDGAARMGFAIESLLDVDDWSKDALMNWKDILKYLLHDFSSPQRASGRKAQQQQAASPLALSADEEATMLSILRASIDENRRHDEKGDDDAETTRLELSRKLAEDVTRLLAKYQADPKCTAEVVSLVQRIDPDIWFGSRVLRTQEALVEELLRVLLRSTDSGILMQTAVALRHLLSSPSGARAAKDGKSRRKSAAADTPARDVIAGSVRRKIAEACEEILLSGLDANLDSLQDLATSDHWDLSSASSSLTTVQSCVKRLDALIGHINVADILSSSDIPAEKSLFSIALKTAEQSAQALQQAQNLLESAQLPTSAEPLARTLEHVALLCLEILLRDVLFEAWTAADAHHVRRDADEIDSATHGGAASAAEAPDEAAAAAAKKRIEDKLVPLAKLCSAFLGSQADVPLGIRATSVKILAASAALAQSDLATSRSLQSAFESVIGRALTEVPRVVDRCVAVTSGLLPALERSAGDDSDNDEEDRRTVAFPTPKLPGCIVRQVRYQMNLLVAQAVKMVRGRYLPEDAAPSMLKWLGVSEEYERAIMQPFAERKDGVSATDVSGGPGEIVMLQAFWDKVVGAVLGDWLVGEQARSLLQLTAQLNTARAQAETLDQIKEGLKRVLDDVVVGSLNESVLLFTQGQVPTLDHTLHLARFLSNDIKTWSTLLQPGKIAATKRDAALDQLASCLYSIGACIADRAGDVLSSSTAVMPSLQGKKNLARINEGWRACVLLGTGALQAMGLIAEKKTEALKIDETERKRLQAKIAQVAIAPLKRLLDGKGLKPSPSSSEWESYFSFVRLLEGKQTEADRRKAAKAVSVAPSREATPAAKGAKKRPRKSLTFKPADEVQDLLEAELPRPKPSRTSTRAKPTKAYEEEADSDAEMQAVDDIASNADSDIRSPAPASYVPSPKPASDAAGGSDEEEDSAPVRQRRPRPEFKLFEEEAPEENSENDDELPNVSELIRAAFQTGKRKDVDDGAGQRPAEIRRKKIRIGE